MDMDRRVDHLEANVGTITEEVIRMRSDMRKLQEQVVSLNESMQIMLTTFGPKLQELCEREEKKELFDRLPEIRASALSATIRCTNYESFGSFPSTDTSTKTNVGSVLEAAESGDDASLQWLLEAGASVSERKSNGDTALHLAAASGHEGAVKILLKAGAIVDTVGPRLQTPLHRAAAGNHVASALCLLKAGAKTNLRDIDGCTPLVTAVKNESRNVFELLVHSGVSLDDDDKEGNSAMVHAARAKDWETVRHLCNNGASINRYRGKENSPLLLAMNDGVLEITKLLLRRAVMSSADVKEALLNVNNISIALAFEEMFPGIFKSDEAGTALIEAATQGRKYTLTTLLEVGVYINSRDSHLSTALMKAAHHGHAECVEVLLQQGANKNMQNKEGWTALHLASSQGHEHCVQILLQAGALTELLDYHGRTALEVANSAAVLKLF